MRTQHVASIDHFLTFTRAAEIDVALSNHPFADDGLGKREQLRAHPAASKPYVIGQPRFDDYMAVVRGCAAGMAD